MLKKEVQPEEAAEKKEAAAKKEEGAEEGGAEGEAKKGGATKTTKTKKKKGGVGATKTKGGVGDVEKGETSMFADKLGNTYPGLEVEKDLKKGLVDKIKSKVADSAANAAIGAAAKISDKLNLGVDLSVDIKIPNRFIVRGWTTDKKDHQKGKTGLSLLVIEEKTAITMNCMSNVMEPGQTFNVKKKTGEGSRDVDKEVIATIKKNPTYLPALADKLYCLKQPIEVWDASGSRIGAFMYPNDPMVDTCFGGTSQKKSLIMHVKDGNGALKYRVVQDSSIGLLDKIFPCLASAETVYGIHPVRPGETGAGLSNGDRILPAVGSYAEVMAKKNACGCWTDPNAVRLKLSDDMDDGDKLLLTALLVDVLGNPGVGVDEEGNGTKKSNLCPIICVGGIICCVVVVIIIVVVGIIVICTLQGGTCSAGGAAGTGGSTSE